MLKAPRLQSASRLVAACAAVLSIGAASCAPAPAPAGPPVGPPTRNIVFPVAANLKYSDSFGAGRSGGRSHEGQDLMAPKGTLAVAAASGTVTFLRHSSDGLSGNMLRITDAEGWQYVYIHINNDSPGTDDGANVFEQAFVDGIRQGQKVVAGEPVAYVGDSGNAENTGAHLHFELRSPDGAAVNAYSSLRAAARTVRSPSEVAAAAPFGAIDSFGSNAPGSISASGWALDQVSDSPVPVSIYVDGTPRGTKDADGSRPDIAAAFAGRSASHGFDMTVTGIAAGSHKVCLIFHNAGDGGGSGRPRCDQITVG